jgi:hypothetical protein
VGVAISVPVFAAGITAIIPAFIYQRVTPLDQQFGPGTVNVNIVGIIEHIGGVAAWRPHINLEGDVKISGAFKKFDMKKTLSQTKSGNTGPADALKVRGNVS